MDEGSGQRVAGAKGTRAPVRAAGLGLAATTALVMGNMIGSGVFLLPAALAPFGWAAVAGWGVTITGALLLVGVLIALGRRGAADAGPVDLIADALGPRAGPVTAALIGWSYWVSIWTANATIAVAAVSYAARFRPALAEPGTAALAAIACLWGALAINLRGAGTAGRVQLATLLIKLVPLVLALGVAAWVLARGGAAALPPLADDGIAASSVMGAAALTLWAMLGFESAAAARDKVADPDRTIPRATLLGTGATGLLYLLVCSAIALLLPPAVAADSPAPFADFIAPVLGGRWGDAVALFAIVSALGALNGWSLLQGEVPLALARAGRLPAWFGATDRRGTPARAMWVSTILASLLLIANAGAATRGLFTAMALLSTAATLWLYLALALAAVRRGIAPLLAWPALAYALWALAGAGAEAGGASLVLMALGWPAWRLTQNQRAKNEQPRRATRRDGAG